MPLDQCFPAHQIQDPQQVVLQTLAGSNIVVDIDLDRGKLQTICVTTTEFADVVDFVAISHTTQDAFQLQYTASKKTIICMQYVSASFITRLQFSQGVQYTQLICVSYLY